MPKHQKLFTALGLNVVVAAAAGMLLLNPAQARADGDEIIDSCNQQKCISTDECQMNGGMNCSVSGIFTHECLTKLC